MEHKISSSDDITTNILYIQFKKKLLLQQLHLCFIVGNQTKNNGDNERIFQNIDICSSVITISPRHLKTQHMNRDQRCVPQPAHHPPQRVRLNRVDFPEEAGLLSLPHIKEQWRGEKGECKRSSLPRCWRWRPCRGLSTPA